MREWAGEGPCLHCGFDRKKYEQSSRCLPLDTILAGKYLVGRVLGQGGFGITYMGFDLNMETRIAIKEYFPVELVSRDSTATGDRVLSLGGDKSVVYQKGIQKYVEEAQNVSRFADLPGIVPVKDFFYENETAYIVMEYINGKSLRDYLIEKGKLSEEESLRIMRPILDALVKVHEAGIIHRDISPDNIMLTFDNSGAVSDVRLIDFGAARMPEKNDEKSLTIILKHGYAPEEQYRTHGEQGPWTDVYAICACLYRMLTGETPVPAMDRLFQDSLKSFPELDCKVSPGTSAAILKGLEVEKENRIQSVQELIGALYEGQKVRPVAKSSRKGPLIAIAFICVVAVVGIGAMLLRGGSRNSSSSVGSGSADLSVSGSANLSTGSSSGSPGEQVMEVGIQNAELGVAIVEYRPATSISAGTDHILFCLKDGTLKARGGNDYGQCRVEDWEHIVAVAAGGRHSLGLRSDGRVLAAGDNSMSQCDVETWNDIVAIAADQYTSFGLREDGTVLVAGRMPDEYQKISEWKDITVIGSYYGLIGIDSEGDRHYAGTSTELNEPSGGWADVIWITGNGVTCAGLREDGTIACSYRQDPGPGAGVQYEDLQNWTDIQQFDLSNRALGVRKDGTVAFYPFGQNLNMYNFGPEMEQVLSQWDHLESIATMNGSVYGLKDDGTILQYTQNYGNSSLEDFHDLEWVQILEESNETLLGKMKDGRILSFGKDFMMEHMEWESLFQDPSKIQKFSSWDVILDSDGHAYGHLTYSVAMYDWFVNQDIEIGNSMSQAELVYDKYYSAASTGREVWLTAYAGLSTDGHISIWELITGDDQDKADPTLTEELNCLHEAETWDNVVQIACDSSQRLRLWALLKDGTVRRTRLASDSAPAELGTDVQKIAVRNSNLLALHRNGTVEMLSSTDAAVRNGLTQTDNWSNITDIAMGESHVVGLRSDGTVVATGSNHCGQCDVDDWTDIVQITAGNNCTVGITSTGELVFTGELT